MFGGDAFHSHCHDFGNDGICERDVFRFQEREKRLSTPMESQIDFLDYSY
jgi:hypothetical protein